MRDETPTAEKLANGWHIDADHIVHCCVNGISMDVIMTPNQMRSFADALMRTANLKGRELN
jgi:hypothetical protein